MRISVIAIILVSLALCASGVFAAEDASQAKVTPKKVEVDSNFDGKVDRTEIYDTSGQISRVEVDSNGDGKIDEWIIYENGKPVQDQRDSNNDGKVDVWIEY